MRNQILLGAVSSVFLFASTHAQSPAFPPERFRAHIEFLADDLLEGRETGTRGHEIAARYVASEFEAAGLVPGGDNGTWLQRVTLQQTNRGAQRGTLTIRGPDGERVVEHATEAVVRINGRESKQDVSAGLVFVGYGIEESCSRSTITVASM